MLRRTSASMALGLAVLLLALLAVARPHTTAADAQTQMIIGLDMQPATNNSDALGRLQPCTQAEVGAEFSADVFIANVPSLSAWELRLDYDPDVVAVELADYNQMLISTAPTGSVFPSLFEPERAGRYFMAATEINGTPDSGSGVLAHLTLKAVGPGQSALAITDSPSSHGPRITGAGGVPVGDDSGDGIWDGQVTEGVVHVGGDCPESTPIPTPEPGTGSGGNPPGGSGSGSGSATGGVSVAVVDDPNPGGNDDDGGSGSGSEDTDAGSTDTDGTSETGGEGGNPDTSSPRSSGGDGMGDIPFVIGGLALGAIALGAVTLFVFGRRGTW